MVRAIAIVLPGGNSDWPWTLVSCRSFYDLRDCMCVIDDVQERACREMVQEIPIMISYLELG